MTGLHLEDCLSSELIRQAHFNFAVHSSQQSWIENVGPIRGSNHDNRRAVVLPEAIHTSEELIERLVPLIIAHVGARRSSFRKGVNFIDKNNS